MADVEMTHPAHRAVHNVRNALQILVGFPERHALQALQMDASDARRLLEEVPADIAALYQCNERLEDDLRGLRDQGIADAQEITELRREIVRLSTALGEEQREREALVAAVGEGLAKMNEYFRQANRLRAESAVRLFTTETTEPRYPIAAGA